VLQEIGSIHQAILSVKKAGENNPLGFGRRDRASAVIGRQLAIEQLAQRCAQGRGQKLQPTPGATPRSQACRLVTATPQRWARRSCVQPLANHFSRNTSAKVRVMLLSIVITTLAILKIVFITISGIMVSCQEL
jgi:hypothetical protein